MTVNDFSDMFVPLVDGFLVRCEESGKMLDAILDYIPRIFAESRQTDTILYPAIQAGMRALEVRNDSIVLIDYNVFDLINLFQFRVFYLVKLIYLCIYIFCFVCTEICKFILLICVSMTENLCRKLFFLNFWFFLVQIIFLPLFT